MDVLVVRHAVAHERNARRWRNDDLRPLTAAGIRKFTKAARGLKDLRVRPTRMLTSPLVRARQTADLLTSVAGWPKAAATAALRPQGTPASLLAELRQCSVARIALVGHEPALSKLIGACIAGNGARIAIEMKKGGVACVRFPGKPGEGRATLRWLLAPRTLRTLAEP